MLMQGVAAGPKLGLGVAGIDTAASGAGASDSCRESRVLFLAALVCLRFVTPSGFGPFVFLFVGPARNRVVGSIP